MTVRVLLADDQRLVRSGFRMILGAESGIEVVGEASDGAEAVALTDEVRPDVVLMDVRMPNVDGIEATRRIVGRRDGSTQVLVLTTFDLDEYVHEALRVGTSGFLLKDAPEEQLIAGIKIVADGGSSRIPRSRASSSSGSTPRRRTSRTSLGSSTCAIACRPSSLPTSRGSSDPAPDSCSRI